MEHQGIPEQQPQMPDPLDDGLDDHLEKRIADDQAAVFRRFFVTRMVAIAAAAWLFSWPLPLLPHTVFWTLLAIAALVFALTSTPHSPSATRDTTPTHSR